MIMIVLQCFKKQKLCKKINVRNSTLYKFLIKIYLESFAFIYHFIIYLKLSTEVFF